MRRTWTAEERRLLLDNYRSSGALALARELNRSPDAVSSQAKRHGLMSPDYRKRQARDRVERSPSVNTLFFDTPTPAAAFVAGYIWACGSIKTKHRKVVRVSSPYGDTGGMRIIQRAIGSRHLIQTYENRQVLEISNSRLVGAFLDHWGMPPGRRRDGSPPRLADELVARFATGYLLARGCRSDRYIRWTGHANVMDWLATRIVSQANVPPPDWFAQTSRPTIRWIEIPAVRAVGAWLDGAQ